jgi:hypothetical protein
MNLEEIIDGYNILRDRCLAIAKKSPALLGEYAWLRYAISDGDITLGFTEDGINCYGNTYTTQTMDHEWFDFLIPFSELD